jgi:hypothetical protein
MIRHFLAGCVALAALAASPAMAVTNLVTNGNFETIDTPKQGSNNNPSSQMSSDGSFANAVGYSDGRTQSTQYVSGWINTVQGCVSASSCMSALQNGESTAAYNMIVTGSPTSTIYTNGGTMTMDSATKADTKSGGGNNFLASDSAYQNGMIMQVISGLTVGKQYLLTYDYAFTQQSGFSGASTQNWTAMLINTNDLTSQQATTAWTSIASQGASSWQTSNTTVFTATNTTEILGFVAGNSTGGNPPFALLDNVSLTAYSAPAVPEPATWAMMLAGFGFIGVTMRRKRFNELWKA